MGRIRNFLGLERNILVMLSSILFLGMGEELWMRFMPKYLEVIGAGAMTIGVYGVLKDILDALYQYPGGWITDRLGRQPALLVFILIAIAGYIIYFLVRSWVWVLVGTLFTAAWGSLTSPAIFAIIGDNLSTTKRAIGFGVQSTLKRIPIVIAPLLGGLCVVSLGIVGGVKLGFGISIVLAVAALVIVKRYYKSTQSPHIDRMRFSDIWRNFDPRLKRLLIADCLVRWAEGIPEVFIILYVVNVLGFNSFQFGSLTSLQMLTSIIAYLPLAKLSDRLNRKPFVLLTFGFFALFPLALALSNNFSLLVVAFIVGGLREIGEPARKAMIVDFVDEKNRGRGVGVYYLIRGVVVFPAALLGGILWTMNHHYPFYVAFVAGILGVCIFAIWGSNDMNTSPGVI